MTIRQREEIKTLKLQLKEAGQRFPKTKTILERDNFECKICGSKHLQLDVHHIRPREFGGTYPRSKQGYYKQTPPTKSLTELNDLQRKIKINVERKKTNKE